MGYCRENYETLAATRQDENEPVRNHDRPPAKPQTTARHRSLLDVRIISFNLLILAAVTLRDSSVDVGNMMSRGEYRDSGRLLTIP